jgi:hypothetical protein
VCAPKITDGRKDEIAEVMAAHADVGGVAYMATLTIPHNSFQSCQELLAVVAKTWSGVKSGATWQRNRDRLGWIGDVRALEVTHGANGWHPHIHLLIFFRPGTPRSDIAKFGEWLFDAWARGVSRAGYGICDRGAFTFAEADAGAGEYVGKWGAPLELTKSHLKTGNGGRTPWQILGDIADKNSAKDRVLFREFAAAFKGRRQLVWSQSYKTTAGQSEPGIRQRYVLESAQSDEDLVWEAEAPEAPETHVASVDRGLFVEIVRAGLTAHALASVEHDGIDGLTALLDRSDLSWRLDWIPGEDRKPVPLLCLAENRGPGASRESPGKRKTGAREALGKRKTGARERPGALDQHGRT